MPLKDELDGFVKTTFSQPWSTREGIKVPEADELKLSNDAVKLTGTVLYADLADSTDLVKNYQPAFAAEIYKNYLYCAAKIVRARGGAITAYDGDRLMAVFLGEQKNSTAAKAALQIHWAVDNIVQPALAARYPESPFVLKQKVGIDTSDLFVARTGIRGSNDLVWVGNAANYAAKLAALSSQYPTYISGAVYEMLLDWAKFSAEPKRNMWADLRTSAVGVRTYGSTYWWPV